MNDVAPESPGNEPNDDLSGAREKATVLLDMVRGLGQQAAERCQSIEEGRLFVEQVQAEVEQRQSALIEIDAAIRRHEESANGVLRIITDPAGREYDKHKLNHSLVDAFTDSAVPLVSTTAAATASAIIAKLAPQLKILESLAKDKDTPPPAAT